MIPFSFRIDLDYFLPQHVMKVLEVAEKHNVKMTWFINGKRVEGSIPYDTFVLIIERALESYAK